ncbi:MAG: hypothetical protein EA391_02615 [Balneolaceae bacterium]|nr:MAG: hypothetical protein EA391_02615 [Balneolaceae bacterium]
MKMKKLLFLIPLFALIFYGCENVSEPIDIESGVIPAFVIIQTADQDVVAGGNLDVVFQLGQTQEENVTVEYSISGDAVQGEDYVLTSGTAGTVVIEFDPETTSLDTGSITFDFPVTAALGTSRNLTLTIESAVTESGESLTIGRGDIGHTRTYTINGLGEVPTGTYEYEATGDFAFAGTFDIVQPDEPISVDGDPYLFATTNIAGGLFGFDVPYAFNVTAGGSVIGAPFSHEPGLETIILDVTGSYDEAEEVLIFDVIFRCCGVEGLGYQIVATPL